jgi:hypothetical protein
MITIKKELREYNTSFFYTDDLYSNCYRFLFALSLSGQAAYTQHNSICHFVHTLIKAENDTHCIVIITTFYFICSNSFQIFQLRAEIWILILVIVSIFLYFSH